MLTTHFRSSRPYEDLLVAPNTHDYQQLLERLVREFSAERGCLWLEQANTFLYDGDEETRKRFPFSRQAVDEVLDLGRGFLVVNSIEDERIAPSGSIAAHGVRSVLCAAARDEQGNVLVLAYFDCKRNAGLFSEEDLHFLREVLALVPGTAE